MNKWTNEFFVVNLARDAVQFNPFLASLEHVFLSPHFGWFFLYSPNSTQIWIRNASILHIESHKTQAEERKKSVQMIIRA